MQRPSMRGKDKFYNNPQKKKKEMTVLSVAKHLKKETKKKEVEQKVEAKPKDTETAVEKQLKEFSKYYKGIGLVPEAEWRTFFQENINTASLTFRFISRHWRCPTFLDTVPGIPSQTDVLVDYMRKKFEESINKMVVNNKEKLSLAPLQWYPNDFGWNLNLNHGDMGKYLGLKEFYFFLNSEKAEFKIQQIEAWSMLPPLLLRLQPHHKVLDLCASPGFMAGQISEIMHSDPNTANEGLLVLNELWKFSPKIQYKWCAGTKAVFTNHDARTYPDLYINDKSDPLRYDRVICDVKCSNDGTMRKNVGLQEQWTTTTSLQYHKQQLDVLRRGLELVIPGGLVLYCTTALNPVENEGVVMALLKEASGTVDLVDVRRIVPNFKFRPGMNTWKVMSPDGFFFSTFTEASVEFQTNYPESVFPPPQKEAVAFHMERCGRVLPHDNGTAGFFCAVLVKNRELPWVKAKLAEKKAEMLAALKETKAKAQEKKKYDYKVKLQPQMVLLDIEWTVENTNRFLQTRTKKEKQLFPIPPHEMDPSCVPAHLAKKITKVEDDNHGFCPPGDEVWFKIKTFFKISDTFDVNTLMSRDEKSKWYLSSLPVRNIIKLNSKRLDISIMKEFGVAVLQKDNNLKIPCDTTCPYMFTEEGFSAMYPYIGKQLVKVTKDDILALVYNDKLNITQLSDTAQADIKETEQGCVLFVYRPSDFNAVPKCNMTLVGARGENYIMYYRENGTDTKTVFRLCGIEWEDYRRKIQDEKLARVLEMEREKKKQEAMDTS